jgi:hypothetical protein
VIEFLDETEASFKNFTPHSYLIEQSKTADHECERNAVPGMIRDKSGWSENGAVQVKQQIQSEYWSIVYYSLLISISSFLVSSIWQDRTSTLDKGDEVTVEPDDKSIPGSLEAVEGSFFAIVEGGS